MARIVLHLIRVPKGSIPSFAPASASHQGPLQQTEGMAQMTGSWLPSGTWGLSSCCSFSPSRGPPKVSAGIWKNEPAEGTLAFLFASQNKYILLSLKKGIKSKQKKINWSSFDHKKVLIGFEFHKKSNSSKHKIYLIKIFLKYNVIKVNTTDTYTILIIYKI